MSQTPTLQDIITSLHAFWADQGCTIGTPHGEKVGAGTMNPATFLRVLGPEPWRVGYVEPSFRADDGRYAENPNRMQMHTQYQVILKPDPGNPQELYLASLSALGLDRTRHDIRFVEDNWESPALGAWGLGWEVWLDGQEITQFTYFQQAGGLVLDPVSVEITYGLERIAMFLQDREEVWSIAVDGLHTYGDLYRTHEVEHSRYNFEVASVEHLNELNRLYTEEAVRCLQHGLVMPAYDYLLRQSHNFNLMDARGAVGMTERAQYFAIMRGQARAIAECHVAERKRAEYPFLDNGDVPSPAGTQTVSTTSAADAEPQSLLFEIGVEELPVQDVPHGIAQLTALVPALLEEFRLEHGAVRVDGTVRRLVVRVADVAPGQANLTRERRGPSVQAAFHADGTPSRAALGFARGQGVSVEDLIQRDNYVYAVTEEKGLPAQVVLPQMLPRLLDDMTWPKTMRWNGSGKAFPRPVRWLLALWGAETVPFEWAMVRSGNATRAPRYREATLRDVECMQARQTIHSMADYEAWLAQEGILLERAARKETIRALVADACGRVNGVSLEDEDLLEEVTDLVEAPYVCVGAIPERFLTLPHAVLTTVMRRHQRYFPVYGAGESPAPLPYFVTIVNGIAPEDPERIKTGNQSVINARLADAEFFIRRDLGTPLPELGSRLDSLVFHAKLGSMGDKVARLVRLTPEIGNRLGLEAPDLSTAVRAAELCKNDLATHMVVEMTSLQGIMGELYALDAAEPQAVGQAIREHYLPRTAEDSGPASDTGLALSLADRLDSLVGLMAVGVKPRGNADPFGLRRLALGLIRALLEKKIHFDLEGGIEAAAAQLPVATTTEVKGDVLSFLHRRLRTLLLARGVGHDVIETVEMSPWHDPVFRVQVAHELEGRRSSVAWLKGLEAYSRCARILPKELKVQADGGAPPPAAGMARAERKSVPDLAFPSKSPKIERKLFIEVEIALSRHLSRTPSVPVFAAHMEELAPIIAQYFESVMVMDSDPEVKTRRLALMQAIWRLGSPLGDLTRLRTDPKA